MNEQFFAHTLRAFLTLSTGKTYALTGSDILSYAYSEGSEDEIPLGACPAAYGSITLKNENGAWLPGGEQLGARSLAGAEIQAELGTMGANGVAYAPAGCFIISDIEAGEGEDSITLSGYDNMLYALAKPLNDTLVYPQTLKSVLDHIIAQSGLALSGEPLCNANVVIAARPDWGENCTLRRALGWTAGAMGCFARFDRAGQLTLTPVWRAETGARLDAGDALSLSLPGESFALNRLIITPRGAKADDAPVSAAADPALTAAVDNTLSIGDNALFRPGAAELQPLALGLLAALQGMNFAAFDGDFVRGEALEIGQRLSVLDLRGHAHASMVFASRLLLEDGLTVTLSCLPGQGAPALPGALSPTGLLLPGALSEGVVTARHIAAGAVTADKIEAGALTSESGVFGDIDAGSITAGKLDTDRLIIGGTEFSIVRALNQLANALIAGDDRISGDVLADKTISAVKVTDDFGAGLELSSNAAVLLLAGLLSGKNSHMELTQDAINMVGGKINIATDDLCIRGMTNGEEMMTLDQDGLTADIVTAREVNAPNLVSRFNGAAVPWKGGIQASISALPRFLGANARLTIPAGTYSEDVVIQGMMGGTLTLDLSAGVTINGSVGVYNCAYVEIVASTLGQGRIIPRSAADAVTAQGCGRFTLSRIQVSGCRNRTTSSNGTQNAVSVRNCFFSVGDCCVEYAKYGIHVWVGASGFINNTVGGSSGSDPKTNCNLTNGIYADYGAHVALYSLIPMGGAAAYAVNRATVISNTSLNTPTAGGIDYAAPTEFTKSYTCTAHCNYRTNESESSAGTTVYQGNRNPYAPGDTGWYVGAMWFDGTAELAGKTIKSARLTIRRTGVGYSEAATVRMGGWPYAFGSHRDVDMPYDHVKNLAEVARLKKNEEATIDVTAWASYLQAGQGLAINEPRNAYNAAQTYSDNYASLFADGSEFVPVLSVTYS